MILYLAEAEQNKKKVVNGCNFLVSYPKNCDEMIDGESTRQRGGNIRTKIMVEYWEQKQIANFHFLRSGDTL